VAGETYAFLDTNYFMHFPPVDAVDWCEYLSAAPLTLVVDQQVLRELDEMKDGGRGQSRRDKARSVVSKLHRWLEADEPQQVRENVYIIAHLNAVAIKFSQERLDPDVQDDRIIGGMMTFRLDHSGARIILIANDSGIRLKARARGFETWSPADVLERIDIASDEEKEILSLRRQVAEHQNRKPRLALGFPMNKEIGNFARRIFPASPKDMPSEEYIKAALKSEETACLSGIRVSPFVSQSMVDEYVGKVNKYLKKFEDHLRFKSLLDSCYIFTFSFGLKNEGAVAHHVEAEIQIPDATVLTLRENRGNALKRAIKPSRPKSPQPADMFDSASYLSPGLLNPFYPNFPVVDRADVEVTDVYDNRVIWSIPIVRTGERKESDDIWVAFPKSVGQGIQMQYSILSSESEPSQGTLNVRFEIDESIVTTSDDESQDEYYDYDDYE
jgi:hypothetical protein